MEAGERAEPRRGVPGKWAGGVTLASRGSASERSLLAASREGGRVELRSPRRAGSASERGLVAASREGGRGELRSPRRAARRRAGRR